MSSNYPNQDKKKHNYSNKIVKILGQKKAISLNDLEERALDSHSNIETKAISRYALTRSLKGLKEAGLVEQMSSSQKEYARLTKEGKKKMHSLILENNTGLVSNTWDGFWRIILLDLPEDRKSERESLRYLLKKANFVCLKNSAWISPYPYEHLFINIKKDLELTTEMIIFTTNNIDEISKKIFFENFKKE